MDMKCWKCGKENTDGANICVYCGVSLTRAPAQSVIGGAMRTLYDRYGAEEILSNSAYLVNGLGDLTEDSKKLRNQIKIALDARLGRLYLEQLPKGKPDASFDARVKILLTEDAGLNEKTAFEIAGYFDEMIGWRKSASAPSHSQHIDTTARPTVPGPETAQRVSQPKKATAQNTLAVCGVCGSQYISGSLFCPRCGAPAQTPVPQRKSAPTKTAETPRQDNTYDTAAPLFQPVCLHILFQIAQEEQLKTGYHFGGADNEGNLDVTPSALTLYKKSKGVKLAFGAIGSAIEGKGKLVETIPRSSIVSYEKTRNRRNGVIGYIMRLRDNRIFKMTFVTMLPYKDGDAHVTTMDRFLTQSINVQVP